MSNTFAELVELELQCWCHGLERVQGKVDINVLHEVIREFSSVLKESIENNHVCDLVIIARRLIRSARCRVSEKEITFYLLSHLPMPVELSATQLTTLNKMIEKVENTYSGAYARLEKKWGAIAFEQKNESSDLGSLSFPAKTART